MTGEAPLPSAAGRRSATRRVWWAGILAALLGLVALGCKAPGAVDASHSASPAPPRGDLPSSMAALGDSITTGFGSCLTLTDCLRNSWSTGDGRVVDSHYQRIVAENPAMRGHAHNFARAGATVADLAGQVADAVAVKPEYVTILIGANDACRPTIGEMTSPDTFRSRLEAALAALRAGDPKAQVMIASIPDVYHVWEVGHTHRLAAAIWKLGVCPSLLSDATSTAAADVKRRHKFRDRIDTYNTILAAACRRYGSRCRWDGGAVHRAAFSLDQLSTLDFFHPNASGQQRLAEVTWAGTSPFL